MADLNYQLIALLGLAALLCQCKSKEIYDHRDIPETITVVNDLEGDYCIRVAAGFGASRYNTMNWKNLFLGCAGFAGGKVTTYEYFLSNPGDSAIVSMKLKGADRCSSFVGSFIMGIVEKKYCPQVPDTVPRSGIVSFKTGTIGSRLDIPPPCSDTILIMNLGRESSPNVSCGNLQSRFVIRNRE